MEINDLALSRAREARAAIERLYTEMRHIFNSGSYKNPGAQAEVLTQALLTLSPEIYGSMGDPDKVELEGLIYVIDRLPKGIEECRLVKLISEEGFKDSGFEVIVPLSRRRNCYRIDNEHMFIEVTRGRSEIYDILTHLTFMYMEAEKIRKHAFDEENKPCLEWKKLEAIILGESRIDEKNRELAITYLSSLLGRTFEETGHAYRRMAEHSAHNNGLFHVIYWLGKVAMEEHLEFKTREITFSPTLRERIGHHIYGEIWAVQIKEFLFNHHLFGRPIHIISANLHSVLNSIYAWPAMKKHLKGKLKSIESLALNLSKPANHNLREKVMEHALENGMSMLEDSTGTNISVQIIDTEKLELRSLAPEIMFDEDYIKTEKPVIIVMDYAFGEQAYETMDELLKPLDIEGKSWHTPVVSISIMGKAGILTGGKGDIMIPTAHIFEGTADNYPLKNDLKMEDFANEGMLVCEGPMITVLGTSLQNRDVLGYFRDSSWKAIGLEMEGAHYQKAIQAAAMIRKNIRRDVVLRYAYYASDNPLLTGSTLASGSLGEVGVKPTYLITLRILNQILTPKKAVPSYA
ncbi:MAG: hypothetical protein SF052_13840 [Bacteroidia bacterium]|nr:hypothetical protein [Bacteroidia bacterium]